MLDRKVVKEFLNEKLEGIEIPENIPNEVLVETFCKFVEDDYYEWLKDNFKTFFNYGNPDWEEIKQWIEKYSKE